MPQCCSRELELDILLLCEFFCEESDTCLHSEEGQVVAHEDYSIHLNGEGLTLETFVIM